MSDRPVYASQAPDEVRPGVFLGGVFAITHVQGLGITHILSIISGDMSQQLVEDMLGPDVKPVRKTILLHDVETSNLLAHLPDCCDFISGAVQSGGKILIHCAAGVSRSVTATVAYVMVSEGMDAELALKYVQKKHPPAWPNEGFRYQLKLFEDMGCKLDPEYGPYKRFLLSTLTQQGVSTQAQLPAPATDGDTRDSQTTYRCRKCRTLVATSSNVVDVEAEEAESANSWRKRRSADAWGQTASSGGDRAEASAVWVEPLRWMDGILGEVQGKLSCPKCKGRLGSFNWSGMQSASGKWVTPAFNLHASRLDAEPPGGLSGLAALKVSQPRGGLRQSISSDAASTIAPLPPPAAATAAEGNAAAAAAAPQQQGAADGAAARSKEAAGHSPDQLPAAGLPPPPSTTTKGDAPPPEALAAHQIAYSAVAAAEAAAARKSMDHGRNSMTTGEQQGSSAQQTGEPNGAAPEAGQAEAAAVSPRFAAQQAESRQALCDQWTHCLPVPSSYSSRTS